MICQVLFIRPAISLVFAVGMVFAQSADSNKTNSAQSGNAEEKTYNGYSITATTELGWRWRSVSGNENVYRSDLNYKQGFRTFDSNLFMHSDTGKGKYFDSLLISNSGWGSDPSGYLRVNMEKIGVYKFNSTIRRINYFNSLPTFVAIDDLYQHTQNVKNTMGDFDIIFLPQNELIRFNLGGSIGDYSGPGTSTMRWNSDEFKVDVYNKYKTRDARIGAEGKLLGFDWSLTEGIRNYRDRTTFAINSPNQGHATPQNTITNSAVVNSFSRTFPVDGQSYFTQFHLHRTFAKKLDFTGRILYSSTNTAMSLNETVSGRDGSLNFIDSDAYLANANSKRPQTRVDLGITFAPTNNFRISNTFSFDQFAVNGGMFYTQDAIRRNASGVSIAPTISRQQNYRVEKYRRFMNTLEGDYQFGKRASLHLGWRYTKRRVIQNGYDLTTSSAVTNASFTCTPAGVSQNPKVICDEEENSTNTLIGGMRIKPVKYWTLFWDIEHGTADNVFGRLENYKFTNLRFRSKFTVDKFSLDLAVITKNNKNPEFSFPAGSVVVTFPFTPTTDVRSEFYSANVNWDPDRRVNISGGFTYRHQKSSTPLIFPYQVCSTPACTSGTSVWNTGYSLFLMHDRYGYVEVAANPVKRITLFAAFRINKDTGEGGLTSPLLLNTFGSSANRAGVRVYQNIIGGYPMSFTTPEFRVAFRLTRNIDWNIGYQYYKYTDVNSPIENYSAHLPFTSLRFYFGGPTADRIR
jgi:hypothetical protein